ncbi:hydroxymethylglutaryl-CoA lyase [Actinomycetospora termitidis]|uniref:Hydroxymethylglutaryl-CoA lyase n=1 Tax=Actinomycetospora termitidis TaxID=3053470 RepID=A0ABT7M0Z3_9PSEU|nr:hydroxymethylglutaryl-CoA lyase [Actinomycetospora sp. Odt1-22]MDL5154330.1 hydroxymethylglutaryl-CoA lyase [Actinomycetospora sp. Odt1-22]
MDGGHGMVGIVEVSPRDGLQNERAVLETDAKVELITQAIAAGASRIESASFVHPKLVPAMADAEAVMERVPRPEGVSHIGLVLNRRGYDRAVSAGVDEVNVVVPASDGFAKANQNSTTEALTEVAEEVLAEAASAGLFATVTIATSFGCPFDGEVDPARVVEVARRSAAAGAREIAVADTIGVGVPTQVRTLLDGVREVAPDVVTRAHFHNTRNTGFANAVAAYEWGVDWLDSSNGGIGGCPFAPAATGNIATEDLVYLLERMGVRTGLDLECLIPIATFLSEALGYRVPALLPRAGTFPG